jgi:hypothetical protein
MKRDEAMMWLATWRHCVVQLQRVVDKAPGALTEVDDDEFEYSIDSRGAIEELWDELTPAEREEVQQIDGNFRSLIMPALKQVNLLGWYHSRGADFPGDWWWHVEEEE